MRVTSVDANVASAGNRTVRKRPTSPVASRTTWSGYEDSSRALHVTGSARGAASEEKSPIVLSVVVPMRNESENLQRFFERLMAVLERLELSYEVVCVDDGSSDDTLARLLEACGQNPAIKVLSLSRNFGKDVALSAGIEHARGAAVVAIDCDLQDPPELIEQMVARWREGHDVVYATRRVRQGEGLLKTLSASIFYRLLGRLSEIPIPSDTGDFRLLDRRVVNALGRLPERSRFMKGLFAWVGFKQSQLLYDREPRHAGATKWKWSQLWNFAIDGITSFSSVPLKIWSYLGLVVSVFAFFYALFLAVLKVSRGIDVPGYTSLMVVVLFLGGVQLITLGIVGEYLARVYNEVKGRPLYLVRERWGFDEQTPVN